MTDELLQEIAAYLAGSAGGEAGRDFIERVGREGVERLVRQVEADYAQAASSVELSGRDQARVTALAFLIARSAGVTSPEGKESMVRLIEAGWLMARWYEGQ